MNTELRVSCPCCTSNDVSEIGRLPDSQWFAGVRLEQLLPGGSLYRCLECGLKFRNPAPAADFYAQLYDNAATSAWSADSYRPDWDLVARYIARKLPRAGRVLDFGCYTGGLLSQLGAKYQRNGVEVNLAAANIASQNIGGDVWSSIEEIPDEIRFDVVIATDAIEHVTNPLLLVEQLTSKLSEDGVLILTTGDANNSLWNYFGANWWYCYYPEHIVFISEDWLDYISDSAGVVVTHSELFRYFKFSFFGHIASWMLTFFYGVFPTAFLGLVRLFRKILGREDSTSILGAGVSRDHLFVVLSRAEKNETW